MLERFGREYFTGPGSGYHDYGATMPRIIADYWYPVVARFAAVLRPPGNRHLDVGCAYGLLAERMRAAGWDSYGIDISEFALAQAERQIRRAACLGSADRLPFKPNTFDLVTCIDVLEHLDKPSFHRAVEELHATLRAGGLVVAAMPNMVDNLLWNVYTPDFLDPDTTHRTYKSAAELRGAFGGFSFCVIRGDTPSRSQFLRFSEVMVPHQESRVARLLGPTVRRVGRYLVYPLLRTDLRYSAYTILAAVK